MSTARSARVELRVTPAQKEIIGRGASVRGQSLSEYAVEVLVRTALRDTSDPAPPAQALGWMRGTATIVGDLVEPTEPGGWEPGELPE